jgi:predicted Zn-dependent protease
MDEIEKQNLDADQIFNIISPAGYDNFAQAERAVCLFFVYDMSYSRAGISKALGMLERHFNNKDKE